VSSFFSDWGVAAMTTLGFFWTALWAFCLGYVISSAIQVFVTHERMQRTMGGRGKASEARGVALGAFFGFISSSCSFAALSSTRALVQKGAGVMLRYRLRLPEASGGHVLDVTDWMYLMQNGTIINRSQFRKFGVTVAELVATMRPADAEQARRLAAE